jgi:benzoyl-CoA-dihydrodiol lyase
MIDFQTSPDQYRHWRLTFDGPKAQLAMSVDPEAPFAEGYELKLNSYDLGVDIELGDAIQRLRFEHPEVQVLEVTSGTERVFCAGANIRMLASSTHPFKVNFCKYTNETRIGLEDRAENSGMQDRLRPSTVPARAAGTSSRWPAKRSTSSTTATARSPSRRFRSSACSPAPAA